MTLLLAEVEATHPAKLAGHLRCAALTDHSRCPGPPSGAMPAGHAPLPPAQPWYLLAESRAPGDFPSTPVHRPAAACYGPAHSPYRPSFAAVSAPQAPPLDAAGSQRCRRRPG